MRAHRFEVIRRVDDSLRFNRVAISKQILQEHFSIHVKRATRFESIQDDMHKLLCCFDVERCVSALAVEQTIEARQIVVNRLLNERVSERASLSLEVKVEVTRKRRCARMLVRCCLASNARCYVVVE